MSYIVQESWFDFLISMTPHVSARRIYISDSNLHKNEDHLEARKMINFEIYSCVLIYAKVKHARLNSRVSTSQDKITLCVKFHAAFDTRVSVEYILTDRIMVEPFISLVAIREWFRVKEAGLSTNPDTDSLALACITLLFSIRLSHRPRIVYPCPWTRCTIWYLPLVPHWNLLWLFLSLIYFKKDFFEY